ncbi:helix-turn-helix transcriptional regulator [Salmonella enterica]|uniref:helix-turn-helix transcriptional regulator n=1 Tax=Salmonella enterica TaxID=28901 RepID=UPI0009B03437|nr:helix-turn-helix transcriptional regulator [Salmonella enterica]EAW9499893.1 helix-turn-helix transcriptional regulator [Salmonella enterica]WGI49115.1 helix-turn-helix transcriptional regulator [Salmonella enterica subsp. diarizonae serovar 48:i:z]
MSNLKKMRLSLRLTQKDLANAIGCTPSSIGHYESGRRVPSVDICHLITDSLSKHGIKISIEEIFPHPQKGE